MNNTRVSAARLSRNSQALAEIGYNGRGERAEQAQRFTSLPLWHCVSPKPAAQVMPRSMSLLLCASV